MGTKEERIQGELKKRKVESRESGETGNKSSMIPLKAQKRERSVSRFPALPSQSDGSGQRKRWETTIHFTDFRTTWAGADGKGSRADQTSLLRSLSPGLPVGALGDFQSPTYFTLLLTKVVNATSNVGSPLSVFPTSLSELLGKQSDIWGLWDFRDSLQ